MNTRRFKPGREMNTPARGSLPATPPATTGQMTGQLDVFHAGAGAARSMTRSPSRLRLQREIAYHGGHLPVRADGRPLRILRYWPARLPDESVRDHNTRSALFGTARVCT